MTQTIELETARFILRKIESSDIEILHSYWSDNIVTEYMNTSFKTLEESQQMVDLLNSLPESNEGMRWAIVDKNSGMVLGSCGYHNVKAECHGDGSPDTFWDCSELPVRHATSYRHYDHLLLLQKRCQENRPHDTPEN